MRNQKQEDEDDSFRLLVRYSVQTKPAANHTVPVIWTHHAHI